MEPFKQRIAALETLGRMNVDAVIKYITHRINVAGGSADLISDTGWEALSIAFHAGGTPRTINSLCDRSFNIAYERNKNTVDAHDVYEATQRLGLRTDVFHYIISLKSKERDKQNESTMNIAMMEQSQPLSKKINPEAEFEKSRESLQASIRKISTDFDDQTQEFSSARFNEPKTDSVLSYEEEARIIKENIIKID